jgi:hypothetical protein
MHRERHSVRGGIAARIEQLWPTDGLNPSLAAIERPADMDEVQPAPLQKPLSVIGKAG